MRQNLTASSQYSASLRLKRRERFEIFVLGAIFRGFPSGLCRRADLPFAAQD